MNSETEQNHEPVGEKVGQAKEAVSQQAGQVAEQGRTAVRSQLDQRSTQLGEGVGSASGTLRRVAEQARAEGNEQHARLVDQAADRSERLSNYLINADGESLLSDVEAYARRQPWIVAGVGLFVGFAVARALKASSAERHSRRDYQTYQHQRPLAPPAYTEPNGSNDFEQTTSDLGVGTAAL